MSKTYQELKKEAIEVVTLRNPEVSEYGKEELIWMYVQGYIVATQDQFDNERKKV